MYLNMTDIKESLDIATKSRHWLMIMLSLIWIGMDFKSMKPYNDKLVSTRLLIGVLCYLPTGNVLLMEQRCHLKVLLKL
jgi:hypothetical protein